MFCECCGGGQPQRTKFEGVYICEKCWAKIKDFQLGRAMDITNIGYKSSLGELVERFDTIKEIAVDDEAEEEEEVEEYDPETCVGGASCFECGDPENCNCSCHEDKSELVTCDNGYDCDECVAERGEDETCSCHCHD